jgi:hypothetical protein
MLVSGTAPIRFCIEPFAEAPFAAGRGRIVTVARRVEACFSAKPIRFTTARGRAAAAARDTACRHDPPAIPRHHDGVVAGYWKDDAGVDWARDRGRNPVRKEPGLPRLRGWRDPGAEQARGGCRCGRVSARAAVAASTGGMAAMLASGRAPAYGQATSLQWL